MGWLDLFLAPYGADNLSAGASAFFLAGILFGPTAGAYYAMAMLDSVYMRLGINSIFLEKFLKVAGLLWGAAVGLVFFGVLGKFLAVSIDSYPLIMAAAAIIVGIPAIWYVIEHAERDWERSGDVSANSPETPLR